MKKYLLVLMLLIANIAYPQTTRPAYCEIVAYDMHLFKQGVSIGIDLGAERKGTIVDKNGKRVEFHSPIDALNYMAKLGWSVKDTYFLTSIDKSKVLHFLLVKEVTDDSQISEGIYVKPKKQKEPYKPGKDGDELY